MPAAKRTSILLKAGRHSLAAQLRRNLATRLGRRPGESIAVGLSGGADSSALLVLLAAIAQREKPVANLVAIHVNHNLRATAQADADHCRALCHALGVPLTVVDVHPQRGREGLAASARALRHQALERTALEAGADWLMLAHHADDALETLLMRLGRGIHSRGLTGISWRRGAHTVSGLRIGRPLLDEPKTALVGFCRHCSVSFVEDPTNAVEATPRGYLRAQVTPALASRWPMIARNASTAADEARCGRWAVEEIARRDGWTAERIDRKLFRNAGLSRSLALLRAALKLRGIKVVPAALRSIVRAALDDDRHPRTIASPECVGEVTSRAVVIRHWAANESRGQARSKRVSAKAGGFQGTP